MGWHKELHIVPLLERLNSLTVLTACRKKKSETPNKGKPKGANGLVSPQLLQPETRRTFIRTVNLSPPEHKGQLDATSHVKVGTKSKY